MSLYVIISFKKVHLGIQNKQYAAYSVTATGRVCIKKISLTHSTCVIGIALSSLGEGSSENFMTSSTFTPWRKGEDRRHPVSISRNASSGNDFADHTVTPSLNDVRRSGTLNAHGMFDFIYVVLQER